MGTKPTVHISCVHAGAITIWHNKKWHGIGMDIGLGTRLLPVVAYIVPMHCHDGMSFAGSDYPQTATTLHSPLHYSLHTQQAL